MGAGYKAIGDKFYLFTQNDGDPYKSKCVIKSHGAEPILNGTFPVPRGVVIKFYVPDGYALQTRVRWYGDEHHTTDSSLIAISTGNVSAVQKVKHPQSCMNYKLSKIQASSRSGLTKGRLTNHLENRSRVDYDDLLAHLEGEPTSADILTVRSRFWHGGATLAEAVTALDALGYAEVLCDFCRSPTVKSSKGSNLIEVEC